jgi:hypothetical protein
MFKQEERKLRKYGLRHGTDDIPKDHTMWSLKWSCREFLDVTGGKSVPAPEEPDPDADADTDAVTVIYS